MSEIHNLSTTDASNTERFPENMAPSGVNDGARALEGIIARYFFDNDGSVVATVSGSVIQMTLNRSSITATGTTSNYVSGLMFAFQMGATSSPSPVSINLNSIGPISLRDNEGNTLSSSALPSGTYGIAIKDGTNDYFRLLSGKAISQTRDGTRGIGVPVVAGGTSCSTGDTKAFFVVPSILAGMNIVSVHAACITAGTTGTMDIQIRNVTQGADILSTKLTIDSGETSSDTAATPAVINTSEDDLTLYDVIAIDIDAVHTTPAKGLVVTIECQLP